MNEDTVSKVNEEEEYNMLQDYLSGIAEQMNNVSEEPATLRDAYLMAERYYTASLLRDEKIRKEIEELNNYPSEVLFDMAQKLVDSVENGEVPEEEMEYIEKKLIVLLAAIRDKVLVKVRTRNFSPEEEEEEYGMSKGR